jgi:hypothetical protein
MNTELVPIKAEAFKEDVNTQSVELQVYSKLRECK